MIRMKSAFTESCSSNLIFLKENQIQEDSITFWPLKLTYIGSKLPNLSLIVLIIEKDKATCKRLFIYL